MGDPSFRENVRAPIGSVSVTSGKGLSPDLRLDGYCFRRTLERLDVEPNAIDSIRIQAELLLGDVVTTYARDVAPGEVGLDGASRASSSEPALGASQFGPTGLMYGRIQSGKTAAMIAFTSIAIDNGFRIVIVLTSNFVELVRQTADRFSSVARALVHASTERDAWESDVANIAKHAGDRGLVVVCAKETRHLYSVKRLLEDISGGNYPAIILDDEADQASLDNNARKRSLSSTPDDVAATKIHDQISELRRTLRHHVFLQVTATPYALFLQNVENPLRPRFTRLMEPGEGYTGGEHFFSDAILRFEDTEALPPIVYVPEEESDELGGDTESPPTGLERAIAFFLVAAAAQVLGDPSSLRHSQNFLCHTSHRKAQHQRLDELIKRFLSGFEDDLMTPGGRSAQLIDWAYEELGRSYDPLPSKQEIVEDILDRLPRRRVRIINSEGKGSAELAGAPNFIIGGNIVGRGLTIPNLLVTYYLRRPRISQMDTMLQHARMFGYRHSLMPLTRVFLPRSLAVRFHSIHRAESDLRELLPTAGALDTIPVQVVGELRATRYGVLDTGSVVSLRKGAHVFPLTPPLGLARAKAKRMERIFEELFDDTPENHQDPNKSQRTTVPVERVVEICDLLDTADWDSQALGEILRATYTECALVFRPMRRKRHANQGPTLPTGAVSGPELSTARAADRPTLFLFRQVQEHATWNRERFWYPSLVFPLSMNSIVYNDSKA